MRTGNQATGSADGVRIGEGDGEEGREDVLYRLIAVLLVQV